MVLELAGNVPGPVSHVTLWEFDALTQLNVTWPAGTVSGVGLKALLLTVSAVVWEFDALTQLNVTCPAGTVSGVGLKALLLTVSAVVWPPGLLPVELLHAATNAATASSVAAVRAKRITPPRVSSGQTCYSYPRSEERR